MPAHALLFFLVSTLPPPPSFFFALFLSLSLSPLSALTSSLSLFDLLSTNPRPPPPAPPSHQPLRFFETFSYLPPLSDAEISKQVDYITRNGWVPALEFADPEHAYVSNENTVRMQTTSGYQDNRYWSMYKLPMFGCTDSSQVLKEIQSATKSFPKAYIRLVAFNPDRQVQVAGMLVHRPTTVRREKFFFSGGEKMTVLFSRFFSGSRFFEKTSLDGERKKKKLTFFL